MVPSPESHKSAVTRVAAAALEHFLAGRSRLDLSSSEAPRVSIVLVLYNRAELTLRCLLSLRGLALPVELILVDNASDDATPRLLERLSGVTIARNATNVGFLRAANQGAEMARAEHVLFLNNDCELLPGSLESAAMVLARDETIGAVGGKLVLLDGTLQEAGSIVWSDGSCAGYGRGDSPVAPAYMFERDVDYCSAAFLLTRRELFLESGGFDLAYAPAYYEDADYGVRLWESGRRVVYDPGAVALHFEFASSPSMAEALAQQEARREVFRAKHRAFLSTQPSPTPDRLAARSRGAGRRILFIDDRVPHAWLGAGAPRAGAIVEGLVRLGHSVTLYPLRFPKEDWEHVYAGVPRRVEVMVEYGVERLESFARERQAHYDVVIVSRDHNLRAVLPDGSSLFGDTPVVYDAEALSSLREAARRRREGEPLEPAEVERLVREEVGLARGARVVTCVSDAEAAPFRSAGIPSVVTVGHAVEPAADPQPFEERRGLLFVGAVPNDASPNADALVWMLTEILPALRKILGDEVSLTVAGASASARVSRLTVAGVSHRGAVDDLAPLYASARVFVAPTRFAAGLPLKIYDAAAHGVPVVGTPLLAGQLGWKDGEDLLVAEDAEGFARACARLYSDRELWSRLRAGALARVAKECSRASFDEALGAALLAACGPETVGRASGVRPIERATGAGPNDHAVGAAPLPPFDDRTERIAQLDAALADARRDLAAYRSSASWRLTAPLRALHAWLFHRRPS